MLRALQTASFIGQALELRPHVWVDIHEEGGMWLDHGADEGIRGYPGLTRTEIGAQFPECLIPEDISENGWWRHKFEERTYFLERAERVAAALRAEALSNEHLTVVTHGGFAAYLLRALLCVPRRSCFLSSR
jgi:broad specificity phosphatase PhoE